MKSILVHEHSGEWTPALRRRGLRPQVPITAISNWNDLLARLRQDRTSFVVLETDPHDAVQTASNLITLRSEFPSSEFVVVAKQEQLVDWMHEAGAVWVATCPWELAPVLRLASRFFTQHPAEPETIYEEIWNTLPWQS